jgi:TetR/AcrR family transcriptional regulator, tetracycline repressor protein
VYSSSVSTASRRPGQRAGLDRTAVLAAARQLLAEGGAAAVTMRAVARALHVAPNALYSHVESRTALLDAVLDDLLAGVEAPSPDSDDPVGGVHRLMSSTYDALTAAPDLVPVYLARQGARGPNAVGLGRVMDALLERAGVDPSSIPEARRVLIVHTIGAAAFATAPAAQADPTPALSARQVRDSFHRSLHWLLTGITGTPPSAGPGVSRDHDGVSPGSSR